MIVRIILFIFFGTPSAFASPQKVVIDSKLIFRGEQISSPRVTTEVGRKAIISQRKALGVNAYSLELRPLASQPGLQRVGYSVMIGEAKNEIHSRGIVDLEGNKMKEVSLNHGEVQIQLKLSGT